MRPKLTLFLSLCLILSGCAGDDGTTASQSPAASSGADFTQAPTADTGSVKGVIQDEELRPLEGVQVALLDVPGKNLEARSDAVGAYGFADVPPGSYRLAVQQLGYESVARKIEVLPGETTEANIVLPAIAVATASYKTDLVAGFLGCSITLATGQSAQPAVTWVCGEAVSEQNWYPNHKNFHTWKVPKGYQTHIAELDWRANSDSAKYMRMQLATSMTCGPFVCLVSTNYNEEVNGQRPVKVWFHAEDQKGLGKEFDLVARVRSGIPPGSTPSAVAVLDQKYTIYVTNFFGEPAAEEFSAAPAEPL